MKKPDYYTHPHQSDRLTMRKLTTEDAEAWDVFMQSKEATTLFPPTHKPPLFTSQDWIERQLQRYQNNQFGLLALIRKEDGKFVGQCGLLTQDIEGQSEVEIGYHLLPDFWKHGYAREAARYFVEFAIKELHYKSVISIIDIKNEQSQKVAIANGMINTKQLIDHNGPSYIFRYP